MYRWGVDLWTSIDDLRIGCPGTLKSSKPLFAKYIVDYPIR
jgi:hypothetical protein